MLVKIRLLEEQLRTFEHMLTSKNIQLADLGLFILHVRHLFSRLLFGAGVRTFEQKDGKYNAAQDPAAHGVHLGAFHPRRPPAACSMQHVSNAATNLIFGAENDRAGSSTSASSPQGARAIVALSQANLIAEAPLRVTARLTPEQDKRSRRGWGLWSGWGRARVREDRGEEDERLMGAASIFYRDDRFYGHLVDGEGRACVDVETWKECVKFGGDIATCWCARVCDSASSSYLASRLPCIIANTPSFAFLAIPLFPLHVL